MQVYIGIDWSEKKHDAVFVNEAAAVLAIVTFEHTPQGLAQLETVCGDIGVDPKDVLVGLETCGGYLTRPRVFTVISRLFSSRLALPLARISSGKLPPFYRG